MYPESNDCISISELMERWKDMCLENEKIDFIQIFNMLFDSGDFKLYKRGNGHIKQGKIVYDMIEYTDLLDNPIRINFDKSNEYYLNEICDSFVDLNSVIEIEKNFDNYRDDVIPIEKIRKELGLSKIEFIDDVLNTDNGRLVTSKEEDMRRFILNNGYKGSDKVPFFLCGGFKYINC